MEINDTQTAAWLRAQQSTLEKVAIETEFPEIQYKELVPVSRTGNEFSPSVTFYSADAVGQAEWINGNADDVPKADLDGNARIAPVYLGGIGYGYGWDEINQARLIGANLESDKAVAARRAYEERMDRVAFMGDQEKGLQGLINQPKTNVITYNGSETDWSSVGVEKLIQEIYTAMLASGNGVRATADTVLVPTSVYTKLASTFVGSSAKTGLEQLQAGNPFTATTGSSVTVRAVPGLDTAGPSDSPMMVAYRNNKDAVRLSLPMAHRFLPAYQAGPLRWEIPGVFRVAGVNIMRKRDVVYMAQKGKSW